MAYELTALGSLGVLGTVGSGAAAGASAGGEASGAPSAAYTDAASGVVNAVLSIWGAVSENRAMRAQQQSGATSSQWASSAFLDDTLFGNQAAAMAREEARAQQAIQSQMGVQVAQVEADIRRQTAQIRQSQAQQDIAARVGSQFGRGRSLPTWAWVGIGIGGVGLTLLVVWFMAKRG